MKITMLTFGSRGDVEPYLALAAGLQKRSHVVTMVAPEKYRALILSYGVGFHALGFDSSDVILSRERPPSVLTLGKRIAFHRRRWRQLMQGVEKNIDDYAAACKDADLIFECGFALGGTDIAQFYGLPIVAGHAFPTMPTADYPAFVLERRVSLGRRYNHSSQRVVTRFQWWLAKKPRNNWRSRVGLVPFASHAEYLRVRESQDVQTLYGFSGKVLGRSEDWPRSAHVTGYWSLEPLQDWTPSPALRTFLENGPPPVFVGFGSMVNRNPRERTAELVEVFQRHGWRGVFQVGGGGSLSEVPAGDGIFFLDQAPFSWLFPRMAAVVHHGGAGTTATAVRAGVPSLIVPVAFDQFSWARIVEFLGIGLRTVRQNKMKIADLEAKLMRLLSEKSFARAAQELRDEIAAENGIESAAQLIEQFSFAATRHATRNAEASGAKTSST